MTEDQGDIHIFSAVFCKLNGNACEYSADERVILGLAMSVFISIYVTVAAMLFVVVYLIKRKRLKSVIFNSPGIKYLWALCALGIAAAVANKNEAGILIALLMAVFFIVGAYARSVMTRALFDDMIEVSCAASIFSFAVAFIQVSADPGRGCSVFINANYYAAVIEIVVLFAVYQLCRVKDRAQRSLYIIVVTVNLAGLYITGCRTAVFALFAAVAVMLLMNRRYRALAILTGLCALLAAVTIAIPEILPRMARIGDDMGIRIDIWRRALEDITRHPLFGEGLLAYYGFHLTVHGVNVVHSHSIYLEPILSFGIIGTGFILAYLKRNLSPIWKMRKIKDDRDRFVLSLGLLVSVALHGAVDATPFSVQAGLLLLLALAVAGIQEKQLAQLLAGPVVSLQNAGSTKARTREAAASFSKKSA